ncbi:hypothetical protein U750_10225 [Streptococcus pseudopneumoniae G42]|nr:hypothetical protein SPPN_07250 [Streptococcus pseudopneumoniae IS7493]EID25812.1 hypothetical protein HMPREF1046_1330 [Streptococcus pseudopneumoniae ATCC BAA-960 = CCUG 49455]EID71476.1 hypothetical protein HMPREF1112_0588 [Streptococcus pseudopneumoniae SK674]ETD91497.1 hypothetical protein U752_10195 [Streptococcus pseudopneumoniae 1321]ETD99820.1 hypothetical protein U753_07890 [Streptococcus pseudopneumoniae 5247]ETE03785.1 hypothetical protein U750_10225 [Streptococcus pseudopneumoni
MTFFIDEDGFDALKTFDLPEDRSMSFSKESSRSDFAID